MYATTKKKTHNKSIITVGSSQPETIEHSQGAGGRCNPDALRVVKVL